MWCHILEDVSLDCGAVRTAQGCSLTVFCLSVPRKMNTHGEFRYTANTVKC